MNNPISTTFYISSLLLIDYLVYRHLFNPLLSRLMFAVRLISRGIRVKGRVVGRVERLYVDQEIQYAPIIEFIDQDGVTRRITSETYRLDEPVINSPIDVYYDEKEPDRDLIDNGMALISRLLLLVILIAFWVIANIVTIRSFLGE